MRIIPILLPTAAESTWSCCAANPAAFVHHQDGSVTVACAVDMHALPHTVLTFGEQVYMRDFVATQTAGFLYARVMERRLDRMAR